MVLKFLLGSAWLSANRKYQMRVLRFLFAGLLVILPLAAQAETAALPRVGVLTVIGTDRPQFKGLEVGLDQTGYILGKNLLLDMKQRKNLTELELAARAFVDERFAILVPSGTRETAIVQKLTRDIPIVFMPATDPVKSGFVKSYAQPGTNLTGLSYFRDTDENGKLLELFKDLMPELRSVVLLTDARSSAPLYGSAAASIQKVAQLMKIHFIEKQVRDLDEAIAVVASLERGAKTGVLVTCSSLFAQVHRLAAQAKHRSIPLYGCSTPQVAEDGALFSYAPDVYEIGRRAASFIDRILKGAKPQDLPVESPRRYELVINKKTAHKIGLTVPAEVLQRAHKIIQ